MTDPEAALREKVEQVVNAASIKHAWANGSWFLVDAIIEAVAPLLTPSAWQPMETCPDGATVLTKMKHGVIEGTWNQAEGVCEGYYFMNITWFPEAWMPLPPAPKERA